VGTSFRRNRFPKFVFGVNPPHMFFFTDLRNRKFFLLFLAYSAYWGQPSSCTLLRRVCCCSCRVVCCVVLFLLCVTCFSSCRPTQPQVLCCVSGVLSLLGSTLLLCSFSLFVSCVCVCDLFLFLTALRNRTFFVLFLAYSAYWGQPSSSDDDKFTPAKHQTPSPHHSSRPAAAHTGTETPLQ